MSQLDSFIALSQTTSDKMLPSIIEQVLNHKEIFVFGELL